MVAPPSTRRVRTSTMARGILSPHSPDAVRDVALLIVRGALAWIFIYYGAGKLFGAFNGPGVHRTSLFFSSVAHLNPGGLFAILGGTIELGGAILIAVGLAGRLAGLALVGDMVIAMITVTWRNGINSQSLTPGYELNVALGALALVVALLGSGRFSLDALVSRHFHGHPQRGEGGDVELPE